MGIRRQKASAYAACAIVVVGGIWVCLESADSQPGDYSSFGRKSGSVGAGGHKVTAGVWESGAFVTDDVDAVNKFLAEHPEAHMGMVNLQTLFQQAEGEGPVTLAVLEDPDEGTKSLYAKRDFRGDVEKGLDVLERLYADAGPFFRSLAPGLIVLDINAV